MTDRPICPDCGKTRCDCIKPSGPFVERPFVVVVVVFCGAALFAALFRLLG